MMSVDADRQLSGELRSNVVTARFALASLSTSTGDAQAMVTWRDADVNGTSWFRPSPRTSTK